MVRQIGLLKIKLDHKPVYYVVTISLCIMIITKFLIGANDSQEKRTNLWNFSQ